LRIYWVALFGGALGNDMNRIEWSLKATEERQRKSSCTAELTNVQPGMDVTEMMQKLLHIGLNIRQ